MNGVKQDSNMRRTYKALIATMWLSPLYIAFGYWQVWDQLPGRMVTHFGANGRPNGWMTPSQSLTFSLVFSGVVVLLFTTILAYAARRMHAVNASTWALMGVFYVIVAVITVICDSVLRYNLSQSSVPITAIGIAIFLSIFLFLVIFLRAQRGAVLPSSQVISEETHAARGIALAFLIPAAPMIASAVIVPLVGVKLSLAAASLALFGAAAMAWDGFHYSFSPAGVDVRTLGFRLRSIHAAEIQDYFVDRWEALGGYGIRGIGNRRAYVWGKNGVWINTRDAHVFLGHEEPERIIRDLDSVLNHHGQEGTPRVPS
jgi:hypothetical protein